METNKNISPIIHASIERIKLSFGGTEVKLLSEEMYRQEPDKNSPAGMLGVDIEIEGVKTFIDCTMAEDIACTPMGQMYADAFVYMIEKNSKPKKNITQYIALHRDGEYKNIIIVDATTYEEAEHKLSIYGWENLSSIRPIDTGTDGIHYAFNGLL